MVELAGVIMVEGKTDRRQMRIVSANPMDFVDGLKVPRCFSNRHDPGAGQVEQEVVEPAAKVMVEGKDKAPTEGRS
jgi:hypothetical protein